MIPLSRDEIVRLASLATGDEKHDVSSYSTLDVLMVLYGRVLRVDPGRPDWEERDRFILSKGHGPSAFYAVLAACGFFPTEWLAGFMTRDSRLGGHPDRRLIPGVEASTGSLGHGLGLSVGTALALLAKGLGDQRVFCLAGDAELNEGSNWEAILLAPRLGLSNLTLVVVDNHSSSIPMGPWEGKFTSFGWYAHTVDGRDHEQLYSALSHRDPVRPAAVIADIQRVGG
jgi:transketolase